METSKAAILRYLEETYHPHTIITYGSYRDGTNGQDSDFDALLIADGIAKGHDAATVAGVTLDVFCYPTGALEECQDVGEFVQLFDGALERDERGIGAELLRRVNGSIEENRVRSAEEKQFGRDWCSKMLRRSARGDTEGLYRRHWLLCDSLSIYCELRDRYYFGPKKTLRYLERQDPAGYALLQAALTECSQRNVEQWVSHVLDTGKDDET